MTSASVNRPPETGYFARYTIAELGSALRAGRVSPVDLVEHALHAATELDPALNAFVTLDAAAARDAAASAAAELRGGHDRGPLHGIPVAVKDIIDTAGLLTTMGARHFARHVPVKDAECVRRLRAAGAIVIGKTTTHEYAYGATGDRSANGATHNPHRLGHMSGGSSAGSAAAVAAGIVPIAVGTDTGGSVRIPAALCGIVGLRPSYGAVPTEGVFPLAPTLDTVGPMARTAADCRALWHVLSGVGPATGSAALPVPRRIGWLDTLDHVDPAIAAVVRARLVAVGDALGAELPTVRLSPAGLADLTSTPSTYSTLQGWEAHAVHAEQVATSADQYDDEVLGRLRAGAAIPESEYRHSRAVQERVRDYLLSLFSDVDLLALPTVGITAPPIGVRALQVAGQELDVRAALIGLTVPWSIAGLPALSLPAGHIDGLPVGLQLVGPPAAEEQLLVTGERVG